MDISSSTVISLPWEVQSQMLNCLEIKDQFNSERVCNLWQELIQQLPNYQLNKNNFLAKIVMPELSQWNQKLVNLLGGEYKIYMLPGLYLGKRNVDLEFFLPCHMETYSIKRGKDIEKSDFLCFNVKQLLKCDDLSIIEDNMVLTLFEFRKNWYMYCNNPSYTHVFTSFPDALTDNDQVKFQTLIEEKFLSEQNSKIEFSLIGT